ncbi:hypothetical protein HII13_001176 [Brettanomyces bruxellensis]|nr:hypothetical protein HII13_001176 [Brettanomyces bruxellensis]
MNIHNGGVLCWRFVTIHKFASRKFATISLRTHPPHEDMSEGLSYEELEKFGDYLKSNGFQKFAANSDFQTAHLNENSFKFSGITLSSLLSHTSTTLLKTQLENTTTLRDIARSTKCRPVTYYKIKHNPEISYKNIVGQLRAALQNPDDNVIYNLMKYYVDAIPTFSKELDPSDVSLIIKRLTSYQLGIVKSFTIEQSNYSRLTNDFDMSSLLKLKGQSFFRVKRIILAFMQHTSLTIHDYDLIVRFFMKNLRYFDAINILADLETKILQNKQAHLTRYLWSTKLQLLCNSEEQTWQLQRYKLNKNRAQKIPEDYHYPYCKIINDNLIPNTDLCQSIILSIGKFGNTNMLEEFIEYMWKIDPTDEKPKPGALLHNDSELFPTFKLLRCIMLAYAYNSQITKAISTCNKFIEFYNLDFSRSQVYLETVLECVGLLSKNVFRDLQTGLWRNNVSRDEYEGAVMPFENKKMFKLCLSFASLQTLLDNVPVIYQNALSLKSNATTAEATYTEDLLMSHLNKCRIRLSQNREFYQAEQLIKTFSVNENMKEILLQKLKQYQRRYLNRLGKEVSIRKQQRADDDDDEMLGLW